MIHTKKYTCINCGKKHEEWPALTFTSPTPYDNLSDQNKQIIAELNGDFCSIRYPDQTDRFIRCTLTQKVVDHCEDLDYGLWVTLSERSFQDYSDNFNNENHLTKYFGWLANDLLEYEFKDSIPTTVFTRSNNDRPEILPHRDFEHPFVRDYYDGITKQEAEKRIAEMLRVIREK
jgi:hypothetical protein